MNHVSARRATAFFNGLLAAKLEHERMTKGTGKSVLNHMVSAGVLTTDGSMYTLHPEALAERTGASYTTAMARVFSDQTVAFVTEAITSPAK